MTLAEKIIHGVLERERFGLEKHGKPLDYSRDPRDWLVETREELLDALFYLEAAISKRNKGLRYDHSNKGMARRRTYNKTAKGRARNIKHERTEARKVTRSRYDRSTARKVSLKMWRETKNGRLIRV